MTYKIFYGCFQPFYNDALKVRTHVFSLEQGFDASTDKDEQDKQANHIVIYDLNKPIATARIFCNDYSYVIGRVCVLEKYRNMKIGNILMKSLEEFAKKELKFKSIELHSQLQAVNFYEKLDYVICSEEFYEEGVKHVSMRKTLKIRGFEVVSNMNANLPSRKTMFSAGYDIQTIEDVIISPKSTMLVKTGLKAYMLQDEVLEIYIRSSIASKRNVFCSNSVGIIDADYYNNESNEGHIMVLLYNNNDHEVCFFKDEFIVQGIFKKYLCVDSEDENNIVRSGGFGSTN